MTEEETKQLRRASVDLPPTPPDSEIDHENILTPEAAAATTIKSFDYPLPPRASAPTCVLEADKKTPDSWLPRDPRLIRLTGVHPFNVEAPLSDLFDEGFLTSPELF